MKVKITTTQIVDAIQYDGKNGDEINEFLGEWSINFGDKDIRKALKNVWIAKERDGHFFYFEDDKTTVEVIHVPTWYEIHGVQEPDDSLTTPGGVDIEVEK